MNKTVLAGAVALAAVAMGFAAQAATVDWPYYSTGGVYQGWKGTTIGGNYTGSYEAGNTYYLIAAEGLSQSTLLGYLREGKSMTDTAITGSVLASDKLSDGGKILQKTVAVDEKWVSDDMVTTYTVVINDKNVYLGSTDEAEWDDVKKMYIVELDVTNTKKLRDLDGTKSYGNAGWYSTVPEPTSGLLLLLGVAGLALRRRRA